jgi:hypothetical protein
METHEFVEHIQMHRVEYNSGPLNITQHHYEEKLSRHVPCTKAFLQDYRLSKNSVALILKSRKQE